LLSAENSVGAYTFDYDNYGRVIYVSQPFGVSLTFGYDGYGYRNLVVDSFGNTERSIYNASGQLLSRVLTVGSEVLRIDQTFDGSGRVVTQSRYSDAAGTTPVAYSVYVYGADGRLASIVHEDGEEEEIGSYEYAYDAAGQLTSILDHGVLREFGYDATGQLTSEDENEYSYDPNGNRDNYEYDETNTNILTSDDVWDFYYDNEGNMTRKVEIASGMTWVYGYDHANHLTEAQQWDMDPVYYNPGGATLLRDVEYKYDAFGNRVQKNVDWDGEDTDPAEVTKFAVDGWNYAKPEPIGNENYDVWADLDVSGSLTTRYLRGDLVDELFARVDAGNDAFWFLNDHLGSLRDIISNDALIQDGVEYDAFGNITEDSANRGRYGWTGREFDVETELQYNRARYYDATIGRWISQDPLGFEAGDSNLYRYVNNRPTQFTDPSGLITYDDLPINSGNYDAHFWGQLRKNSPAVYDAVVKYGEHTHYNVHHMLEIRSRTNGELLARRLWDNRMINVHDPSNLFLVPARTHHRDLSRLNWDWWYSQMRANGWTTLNEAYQKVDLDEYMAFQNNLRKQFQHKMIPVKATMAHLNAVRRSLDLADFVPGRPNTSVGSSTAINRHASGRVNSLSRIRRTLKIAGGIAAAFGVLEGIATAASIANPNAEQQAALETLLNSYDAAIDIKFRGGSLINTSKEYLDLKSATVNYLTAIDAPGAMRGSIVYGILGYIE